MHRAETRELAYFVAVAEELHFGRAAERLGIAQPPLSRAIRQLEQRLGVTLLDRTSRSVRLTVAGGVLLDEGRKALAAVAAATRATQRAAEGDRRLRIVTKPEGDAGLLERILPRFDEDPDAAGAEVVVCRSGEQVQLLRDGRAHVGFLHPPHDPLDGLDGELLLTQPQVAVLPAAHRLADRAVIELAELDDEPLPVWPPRRPADATGPAVGDPGQLMSLVALGQLVAVVPRSVRRFGRADVVYVPVSDAPESRVVLAWPAGTPSAQVLAFRRASLDIAAERRGSGPTVNRTARRRGAHRSGSATGTPAAPR